jgi:hypothetical protein
MSQLQLALITSAWGIALIPLTATLIVFVLTKFRAVKTPITEHYSGPIVKLIALLTSGGFLGLVSMAGGLGAGVAAALAWLGVLSMQGNAGIGGNAAMHWDHFAFILLMSPALTVILTTGMLFYFGWNAKVEGVQKTPRVSRQPKS